MAAVLNHLFTFNYFTQSDGKLMLNTLLVIIS